MNDQALFRARLPSEYSPPHLAIHPKTPFHGWSLVAVKLRSTYLHRTIVWSRIGHADDKMSKSGPGGPAQAVIDGKLAEAKEGREVMSHTRSVYLLTMYGLGFTEGAGMCPDE